MERHKALVASSIVAVALVAGAAAFAANSGLVGGRTDNVGNLDAVTTSTAAPTVVTVYIDPTTGAVVTPSTMAPAPVAATAAPTARGEHESGDGEEGEGDD